MGTLTVSAGCEAFFWNRVSREDLSERTVAWKDKANLHSSVVVMFLVKVVRFDGNTVGTARTAASTRTIGRRRRRLLPITHIGVIGHSHDLSEPNNPCP